jgi:L-alanine-DL-glutamate epimerase-like enolase superfamily enzyme
LRVPFAPKSLALAFTANHLERSDHGEIAAPDSPRLGIDISPAGIQKYLVEVDINVSGKTLYTTPTLP